MFRTAIRNVRHHVVRLLLSGVAIVLGVAFVVGTLIFTDTMQRTFTDLFEGTTSDVVVTAEQEVSTGNLAGTTATLPASMLDTVRDVDGVTGADGSVLVDGVTIVGTDGSAIGVPGAPQFGANWNDDPALHTLRLESGRGPSAPDEVALDKVAAQRSGYVLGDAVSMVGPDGPFTATLVGTFRYGTSGNLAGATIAAFSTPYAQDLLLNGADAYTEIDAMAADGVTQQQATAAVQAALGSDVQVRTGAQTVDDTTQQFAGALGFINVFLLVFAGIALFVGTFIILNTFSMLVAQRSRELALLRALGATRAQVIRSLVAESAIVGLAGSIVGVVAGIGVAMGLHALFTLIGAEIPTNGMVIGVRTVVVGLVLGTVVTVIAAIAPAIRASRIAPMAALRDDATLAPRSLRVRAIVGAIVVAAGTLCLVSGAVVSDGPGSQLVGLGAAATLVGVVILSPVLAGPVVRLLGAIPQRLGTSGRLAVGNARRQPRRTAATASALMIGLALVSALTIVAASAKTSVDQAVDRLIGADLIVKTSAQRPFPTDVATDVAAIPGVGEVSSLTVVPAEVDGVATSIAAIDPNTVGSMLNIGFAQGNVSNLRSGGIAVDTKTAEADRLRIGDRVDVVLPIGGATLPVVGIYEPDADVSGFVVGRDTLASAGVDVGDLAVYAKLAPGGDLATVQPAVERALAGYPTVTVQNLAQYKQTIIDNVNQLLVVMMMLLSLAVLIAVLGIVNTLALSVIERTREIGMLRALGALRRQIRSMVVLESLIIASYGALVGLVLGVGFAVALQHTLVGQGIEVLEIPWASLVVFFVISGIVGVAAALGPAFRAGRLNVLEAITTE